MLLGRDQEQAEIDRLLDAVRAGDGGALVLRGEAGIGKTALLDYAAAQAADEFTVLRTAGVESESTMPFAALHVLLHDFTHRFETLPPRQNAALHAAMGLNTEEPDPLHVGLAVLTLMSSHGPQLCLLDNVQWLDSASLRALTFAARRLRNAAMIFAAGQGAGDLTGMPEVRLPPLDRTAAAALVDRTRAPLPVLTRRRILEQARGNPLALTGRPSSLRDRLHQQIHRLPVATRTILLLAAADPVADLPTVSLASQRMNVSMDEIAPAEEEGIVVVDRSRIAFTHPLASIAAYEASPLARRLAAHRALAHVLDHEEHSERWAWHVASAVIEPDEQTASALEAAARWVHIYTAKSELYEYAANLTVVSPRRGTRLVAAAHAALDAGEFDRARSLADRSAQHALEPTVQASLARLRATLEFEQTSPRTAHSELVEAADNIVERAPAEAAALLVEALRHLWYTGEEQARAGIQARLEQLSSVHDAAQPALVRAVTRVVTDPRRAKQLVPICCPPGTSGIDMHLNASLRFALGDDNAAERVSRMFVSHCRTHGISGWLPHALQLLAQAQLHAGNLQESATHAVEALRLAVRIGQHTRASHLRSLQSLLAALTGDEEECRDLASSALSYAARHEVSQPALWATWALGILDLSLGQAELALDRFETAPVRLYGSIPIVWTAADHIEAAVRSGHPEQAQRPLAWLQQLDLSGAQALIERCHALLSDGTTAAAHYTNALRLHRHGHRPFERARTQLLYGEWLRRERQLAAARLQLSHAMETFQWLGARIWAQRAHSELRAACAAPPRPRSQAVLLEQLTPQERNVVQLAATGATNKEIAAQLFLSPRTVGFHLYRAFPKLGISSRHELIGLELAPQP